MAALLVAAGCSGEAPEPERGTAAGQTPEASGRPVVVVSVPPLAWFVERIAGDRVEVSVMVPPGASPAVYEPTPRQMATVSRAALYLAVGHPRFAFEAAWMDALTSANPEMAVVRVGAGCPTAPDDPHVWLSTECARHIAAATGRALGDALAAPPEDLRARIEDAVGAVDSVAAEVARRLEPHRGRAFLVFHPALGYLAREFGLRQLALQRGASGAGPGELAAIIRTARRAGIQTVFVQPQFSREAAGTVAAELPGGRVVTVDPLARDWASALTSIAAALASSFGDGGGPPAPGGEAGRP